MLYIVLYSGTCLIRHTKGPGKCIRLYRILEYSGFILVNRNTLGPYIFVGCHRMSENSGFGLHKFHCRDKITINMYVTRYKSRQLFDMSFLHVINMYVHVYIHKLSKTRLTFSTHNIYTAVIVSVPFGTLFLLFGFVVNSYPYSSLWIGGSSFFDR